MQEYEQSVFISYAGGGDSEEIVDRIDQALHQRGLNIIRDKRDLGYKGSIRAFMERMGQGNCVIVILSDSYLRSANCMSELVEIAEAEQFHDRVFPVVLSDAEIYDPVQRLRYVRHWEDKLSGLDRAMRQVGQANLQGIRDEIDQYSRIRDKVAGLIGILKDMNTLTPEMHRESDFSEIYAAIEQRMTGTSGGIRPATGESPYMGLRYFDTSDAGLFYGREGLTHTLTERAARETFLAIIGASGSGKSSVARAGLISAWKQENESSIVHVLTPTSHPLESLAASLTRDSESVTATSTLIDDMQKDPRSLRLFVRKLLNHSREAGLLLVVDQFEETFTLCKDVHERRAFIENLLTLAEQENNPARVVITLRADFYHHCSEYERLRLALEKHQAYIGAMTQDELREAIVRPAENNGWDFQPGLVDLILQDVGTEPGALPLLSHALLETWKRRQGYTLTLQGYHEVGGVKKAIARTAETFYDQLAPVEQTIAREIFLRLTRIDEDDEKLDTRRRVLLGEMIPSESDSATISILLDKLTNARLIVKTVNDDRVEVEVAHEALIGHWERLRVWSDSNRRFLVWRQKITDRYWDWQNNNGELLQGSYLIEAENFLFEQGNQLSTGERKYIEESMAYQARRQKLLRNMNRGVLVPYILLAILVGVIGSYVVTLQVSNSLQERLANQLLEAGRVVSDTLIRKEFEHVEAARLTAFTRGMGQAIRDGDVQLITQLVMPIMAASNVDAVMIFGADGREVFHAIRQTDGSIMDVSQPGRPTTLTIVLQILKEHNPESLPKRELALDPVDGQYYYFTTLPIVLDGQVLGAVAVGTSMNSLIPSLKSTSLADVIIYGADGAALASSLARGAGADALFEQTISIPATLYQQILVQDQVIQGQNISVDDRSYSLALGPLRVASDRIGVFAVVLPSDFVVRSNQSSRTTYVVFFTALFLLIIIIGLAVWRFLINPLYAIEKANRIIQGKSNPQRRDWRLFGILISIGLIMMCLAGQAAVHIAPSWKVDSSMASKLDVDLPPGWKVIEPIDPAILTPPSWISLFLTPNATLNTPTETVEAATALPETPTPTQTQP